MIGKEQNACILILFLHRMIRRYKRHDSAVNFARILYCNYISFQWKVQEHFFFLVTVDNRFTKIGDRSCQTIRPFLLQNLAIAGKNVYS